MIKINKKKLFTLVFLFFSFFVISGRINSIYANYKWNITLQAVCQTPSKVLKPETKLRMFRILWPWVNPNGYSPWDFNCRFDSEEGNNSSTHFMEILSENPLNNTQGIYVGLELPVRDNKKAACSEGVAFEPYEITPSVPNICSNIPPSGDYICFGKYFNPYNFMARWSYNRLAPGNYTIKVRIPDEYCYNPPSTRTPCLVPSPPSGLSGFCSASGTSATVSWNSIPGATSYALRIDDTSNGWTGTCSQVNPGDVCIDYFTGTSYTFSTTPGHNYSWWVHSINNCGWSDSDRTDAFIRCSPSTSTQTPTPTPYCPSTNYQGDANCDGKIDGRDYSMWLNRRCTTDCLPENLKADFNDDNVVDNKDYEIWKNNRQR